MGGGWNAASAMGGTTGACGAGLAALATGKCDPWVGNGAGGMLPAYG